MGTAIAFAATSVICFGLGVGFHKWVISEAESIKAHISAEVAKLKNKL